MINLGGYVDHINNYTVFLYGDENILKFKVFYNWLIDNISLFKPGKLYNVCGYKVFTVIDTEEKEEIIIPEDVAEDFNIHYRLTGGETGLPYAHNDRQLHIISTEEFLKNKRKGLTEGCRVLNA